jgi:hypothetical protein
MDNEFWRKKADRPDNPTLYLSPHSGSHDS